MSLRHLSCRSFSTKEPLNICHFCWKWLIKIRNSMNFCHPVSHVCIHELEERILREAEIHCMWLSHLRQSRVWQMHFESIYIFSQYTFLDNLWVADTFYVGQRWIVCVAVTYLPHTHTHMLQCIAVCCRDALHVWQSRVWPLYSIWGYILCVAVTSILCTHVMNSSKAEMHCMCGCHVCGSHLCGSYILYEFTFYV